MNHEQHRRSKLPINTIVGMTSENRERCINLCSHSLIIQVTEKGRVHLRQRSQENEGTMYTTSQILNFNANLPVCTSRKGVSKEAPDNTRGLLYPCFSDFCNSAYENIETNYFVHRDTNCYAIPVWDIVTSCRHMISIRNTQINSNKHDGTQDMWK